MNQNQHSTFPNPNHTEASRPALPLPLQATEPIPPAPAEVAKRAYFNYVNQGSQDGHDSRHWLEAEAQLRTEIFKMSRIHGF